MREREIVERQLRQSELRERERERELRVRERVERERERVSEGSFGRVSE